VNVSVVADEICDEAYGGDSENPIIFPSMMCAGDTTKGNLHNNIHIYIYVYSNIYFKWIKIKIRMRLKPK
jgi:hypothetical protein